MSDSEHDRQIADTPSAQEQYSSAPVANRHTTLHPLTIGIAWALVLAVLIGGVIWGIKSCMSPAEKLIDALFQDNSGDNRLCILKEKEMAKLVTVEFPCPAFEWTYSTRWAGSDKKIRLRADFKVLAGVDLTDNFGPEIFVSATDPNDLTMGTFKAEIMSVEMVPHSYKIVETSTGWWNRLTHKDQAIALNYGLEQFRKHIEQDKELLRKAEDHFFTLVQKAVAKEHPQINLRRSTTDNKTFPVQAQ